MGFYPMMFLFGLHFLMLKVRCVASMGSRMNIWFLDWEK